MSLFNFISKGFTGAHQNTIENVPVIVLPWVLWSSFAFRKLIILLPTYRTLIAGIRYPIPAAVACGFWSFTRIIYTLRYGTGEPSKVICFAFQVTLISESYS